MKKYTFQPGDRIAYAAKFLKDTGQFTGAAPQRRGTFLRLDDYLPNYGFVRWDDIEDVIAAGKGDYAEADYCEEVRRNGSRVALSNVARVGSARFALNDL